MNVAAIERPGNAVAGVDPKFIREKGDCLPGRRVGNMWNARVSSHDLQIVEIAEPHRTAAWWCGVVLQSNGEKVENSCICLLGGNA